MNIFEVIFAILLCVVIYAVPVAMVIWFILSLVKFLNTPKSEAADQKKWLCMVIVSASITTMIILIILPLTMVWS